MASPQLENGFAMIASELVAALFIADFGKDEMAVLSHVILSAYGPPKKAKFTIDHIELASLAGGNRSNFRRAVRNLVSWNVLKESGSKYSFVKDYDRWLLPSGDPRIGEKKRGFIASSTEVFGVSSSARKPRTPRTDRQTSGVTRDTYDNCRGVTHDTPNAIDVSPVTPLQLYDVSPMTPEIFDASSANPCHLNGSGETFGSASAPILEDKREEDFLSLAAKEEAAGSDARSNEASGSRPKRRRKKREHAPDPRAGRLVVWVREKLVALEYDAEALEDAEALCRDWCACGGNPEWCAQAYQASIDCGEILDLTPYSRAILKRMYTEHREGLAVIAPAFCDFRADPDSKPAVVAVAPAIRPGYGDRARADQARFLASFDDYTDQETGR